jgi:beta-galactosidase
VKMLKEAGFNAIRSSHNPCSRSLLDACDYYGIYVMDESWDMWFQRKNKYDYAIAFEENWQYDLKNMVEKDYNHPCVLFYSIGNEVSEPASEKGLTLAKEMTEYLHDLDQTRYVTGGFNLMLLGRAAKGMFQYSEEEPNTTPLNSSMMFNKMASMIGTGMNKSSGSKEIDELISPLMDCMDIAGYNYASGRYEKDAKLHPNRLIIGTETFPQDIVKNWEMVKKLPNLIGDFMWTAWDYLGEAGIGAWAYTADGRSFNKPYPWLLGDVGALDLLGNPNGEIYQARAAWNLLKAPVICVQPVNHPGVKPAKQTWRGTNSIPCWSFKDCEKNPAVIEVYANQDAVKAVLICNGKIVGKKRLKTCKAVFKMRYQPGKLEAVVYDKKNCEIGRSILVSACHARPVIHSEKDAVAPEKIVFLPIAMEDQNGVVEANDDRKIQLTVENGELLGFGSANPRTEDDFLSNRATTYYGRAMAAVRAGKEGILKVTVSDNATTNAKEIKIREEAEYDERY